MGLARGPPATGPATGSDKKCGFSSEEGRGCAPSGSLTLGRGTRKASPHMSGFGNEQGLNSGEPETEGMRRLFLKGSRPAPGT